MSALADVADEHQLKSGRRSEGMFYSARSFFAKLTTAVGHLVAGVALDLIKFPHGAKIGDAIEADTVHLLGLIDGPLAAIPAIISLFFYSRYRLNKRKLTRIQRQLRSLVTQTAGP